ncbi:MAG: ribbon-helix-helix domain-containing protein [Lachnospiraceae bacterium]|nr:ribbon-helix-helix domain-containing protein [Lachnospiraceae bacterium]
MARPSKPNHPVTVRLEQALYERLNQFCEDSGQPKTVAVERALAMYIDDYYEKMKLISNGGEAK